MTLNILRQTGLKVTDTQGFIYKNCKEELTVKSSPHIVGTVTFCTANCSERPVDKGRATPCVFYTQSVES